MDYERNLDMDADEQRRLYAENAAIGDGLLMWP
jgi:hypothetical protein